MSVRDAVMAAARSLRALAGQPIVYRRPDGRPQSQWPQVSLTAVMAEQMFEAEQTDGQVVLWQGRDWWIAADELVLDGARSTPQPGDQIIDQQGRVYEVMSPAGQPVWRMADPYGHEIRVHSKLTESP